VSPSLAGCLAGSPPTSSLAAPARWLPVLVVTLAFLVLAGSADACAVCFQAKTDASRIAFIASTAAMTALPLVVIGGLVWWVRKRFRAESDATAARVGSAGPQATGALSRT
jgi:hypothetical protein